MSHLNDEICDCCDGADEPNGACEDICEILLADERAKLAKAQQAFREGSQKRQHSLSAFKALFDKTMQDLREKDVQLVDAEKEIIVAKQHLAEAKLQHASSRRAEVATVVDRMAASSGFDHGLVGLFDAMSTSEIERLILYTCQLSGEMKGARKEKTCVPLRLAGVDTGFLWREENFDSCSVERVEGLEDQLLADIVYRNALGQKTWDPSGAAENKSTHQDHTRRISREHDLDDDYIDEEEEDDEYYDAAEDSNANEDHVGRPSECRSQTEEWLRQSSLSNPRMIFLQQLASLESGNDEADEGQGEASDSPKEKIASAELRAWTGRIERGLDYAASAHILIKSLPGSSSRDDLVALAMMTVLHSSVSMEGLWEIVSRILSEDGESPVREDECFSLVASVCPPKTVVRQGTAFPPKGILEAGERVCASALESLNAGRCLGSDDAAEGDYGYNHVTSRPETDPLNDVFQSLDKFDYSTVKVREDQVAAHEQMIGSIKSDIASLEKDVGGRDSSNLEMRGELHSLKGACHEVTAGKYVYEVCIDGQAHQKDIGQSHGTSLGHWEGMSMENGKRVMSWKHGQKCWNGPQRSASVVVTCGSQTKILTADEPDTCRYVLEMESPIACDDHFVVE